MTTKYPQILYPDKKQSWTNQMKDNCLMVVNFYIFENIENNTQNQFEWNFHGLLKQLTQVVWSISSIQKSSVY